MRASPGNPGNAGKPAKSADRRPRSPADRRRRIPLAVAALCAVVILATSFPLAGLFSQHRQLSAAAAQLDQLQRANRSLARQQHLLSSKAAVQRLARERYQLVSPGQTLYDVLPPGGRSRTTIAGGTGQRRPREPASGGSGRRPGHVARPEPGAGPGDRWHPLGFADPGERRRLCRVGPVDRSDQLLVPGGRLARILAMTGRPEAAASDRQVVARLLGRVPSGGFAVAVRSDRGAPAVIENAPFLFDGTPMPTRYWLVDPDLREAVSRLESTGGVRQAEAEVPAELVAEAHRRYRRERDALVGADHRGPRPSGGVGGTRQGIKCLHAHLAWWLTGADDPVGEWTAERIGLRPSGAARSR